MPLKVAPMCSKAHGFDHPDCQYQFLGFFETQLSERQIGQIRNNFLRSSYIRSVAELPIVCAKVHIGATFKGMWRFLIHYFNT